MFSITPDDLARIDAQAEQVTGPRPLVKSPRAEAVYYEFGKPESRRPGYAVPSPESLKGLSRVQLRDRVRRSGRFPTSICSFLTRYEMKLVLAESYPFDVGANYGADARTITGAKDLIALCADRRFVFHRKQAEQTRIRRREKLNVLGEAARVLDVRELIERTLAGKTFELVDPEPVYLTDRVNERFYDLDGRAGRGSYYLFIDRESGVELPISPKLWYGTVRPDPSLVVHFRGIERMVPPRQHGPVRHARAPKAERLGSVELTFADFEVGS